MPVIDSTPISNEEAKKYYLEKIAKIFKCGAFNLVNFTEISARNADEWSCPDYDKPVVSSKSGDSATAILITDNKRQTQDPKFNEYYILETDSKWDSSQEITRGQIDQKIRSYADAVKNRTDQILIDAIDSAAKSDEQIIPHQNEDLTFEKLIEARDRLSRNNIPDDNRRHIVMDAKTTTGVLKNDELRKKMDPKETNALLNLKTFSFLGFQFHTIADLNEGGLPSTSVDKRRDVLVWHESAIEFAFADKSLKPCFNWKVPFNDEFTVGLYGLFFGACSHNDLGTLRIQVYGE